MWEVSDERGEAVEEAVREVLEAEEGAAEPEVQQANGTALAVAGRLKRGATLVGRSVRLLSDQLSTITSMVEALCNEGDSLRRSLEETRQRTQNAAHLTAERSEALWELVNEMNGMGERTRASATLVKRLRKSLKDAGTIPSAVARMADSIEHMVVEARLEVGRAGEAGAGMKVVVDEIRKLGRESARLNKDVGTKLERIRTEVDDMVALLEEDRREARAGGRLARRAENALGRVERDLNDVDERTDLLAEMAVGQSEIGTHVADQLVKLAEVVDVTVRVAKEQVRLVQESLGGEGMGVAVEEEA